MSRRQRGNIGTMRPSKLHGKAEPIYAQRKLVAAARMHDVRTAKHVRLMKYGHSTVVVANTWRELRTNTA
jgi:hypothetical protein